MSAEPIRVEYAAGVLTLTINRPEVRNAIDGATYRLLAAQLRQAATRDDIRVVVIAGEGSTFCAGVDVAHLRRITSTEESLADAQFATATMHLLATFSKPTIAAVQGPAYGAGVGLVLACDIAIATDAARFALSEVRLGLVPGLIGPMLKSVVGRREATRLLVTGQVFDANEALRIGMVHEVVAPSELRATVDRYVAMLKSGGASAIATTKRLLADDSVVFQDPACLDAIARMTVDQRATAEAREGLAAFLAKRKPSWVDESKG